MEPATLAEVMRVLNRHAKYDVVEKCDTREYTVEATYCISQVELYNILGEVWAIAHTRGWRDAEDAMNGEY